VKASKKALGKTDIELTPICLGNYLLGYAFPRIDQEVKNATVKACPELLDKKPPFRHAKIRSDMERSRKFIAAMEEIGSTYNATVTQVALN
jgi:aryl-alcohol dehydrogenase-like predicted oxidoreductase